MSTSSTQNFVDEIIFDFDGQEDTFELSELITPELFLSDFISEFMTDVLDLPMNQSDMNSFEDLMNYLEDLPDEMSVQEISEKVIERARTPKISDNTYIDDDVNLNKNKTFIVENGSMLFINGDLDLDRNSSMIIKDQSIIYIDDEFKLANNSELNIEVGSMLFVNDDFEVDKESKIYGNVIINGDAKIEKDTIFEGTLYVKGDLTIENNVQLGSKTRPAFIFVDGDINIKKDTSGYAYIMGDDINIEKDVTIIGGVYAHGDLDISDKNISIKDNDDLDLSKLFDFAVPDQIKVPSEGDGSSSDSDFIITYPKLN
jgi:NDP-sugar pyrophosphorylase family protein